MSTESSTNAGALRYRLFISEGRLRPVWLLLLYWPVLLIAGIVIAWPITTVLTWMGSPPVPLGQVPSDMAGLARKTISVGLTLSVLFVGTWFWRRFLCKRDMASLGLGIRHRPWLGEFGIGAVAGLAFVGFMFLIEVSMGWIDVRGLAWQIRPIPMLLAAFYFAVVTHIEVAVKEEVVYRGYLLQTLEGWLGLPTAVIVSSAVFGIWHLTNPTTSGWLYYSIPLTITLGGILIALLYLVRRSLWLVIGFHFAWNLCEYEVFALVGAQPDRATVLVTEITGPPLWVGQPDSAFGPEAGLLGVLTVAFGVALLWWILRKRKMHCS